MTNQEAIKMLTAKGECIRRETSGTDIDCNLRNCDDCKLCYAQGTTGEQREALNMAISALRAQEAKTQLSAEGTTSDLISRQDAIDVLGVFTQADALGHTPKQIVEALPSAHPEIEERKEESAQNVPKEDLISRKAAIDALMEIMDRPNHAEFLYTDEICKALNELPSAQPESYQEKLKEIADELSEKFAYLNTCLNERDIILGYLGVKRPSKIHCDTDCTNTKCECNHHYTKSPSAQPEVRTQMSSADCISRQDAIDALVKAIRNDPYYDSNERINGLGVCDVRVILNDLPSAQPESKLISWLLDEIWDEDMWELNWQAFPEILCRKLVELGYVKEKDGEYERSD